MPTYVYRGESKRLYPYPPLVRELEPGDEVELEEDEVPTDGRFILADPAPAPDQPADPAETPAPAKATKAAAKTPKEQTP